MLEEEAEDHIDIVGESVGEEKKPAEEKQGERKAVKRGGCYGPEQFTEEDVQAGAAGEEGEEQERSEDQDQSQWCSQCQASTTLHSETIFKTLIMADLMQGGLKDAVVSVVCWHVLCRTCWLSSLSTKKACRECGAAAKPGDLRRVFL